MYLASVKALAPYQCVKHKVLIPPWEAQLLKPSAVWRPRSKICEGRNPEEWTRSLDHSEGSWNGRLALGLPKTTCHSWENSLALQQPGFKRFFRNENAFSKLSSNESIGKSFGTFSELENGSAPNSLIQECFSLHLQLLIHFPSSLPKVTKATYWSFQGNNWGFQLFYLFFSCGL